METHGSLNCITADSAFLWVGRKIWQKDGEKVELNICDQVIVEGDKSISMWLFSSKEGQVKSKKKENRADVSKLWEHVCRVKEFLDTANTGDCHSNRLYCLSFSVDSNTKKKWEVVRDISIFNRNCRVLLVVPTTQMQNSRLLKVDFRRDRDNFFQPPKVKCFIPIDHKHGKGKGSEFPVHFQECHNSLYSAVTASYCNQLVKVLDSRSSAAVTSMVLYLYVKEVEVDSHVPINSTNRYRAWLCFVEEISCMEARRQAIDCATSVSSKLTKHLDPELQSQASLIKPWAFCMGDFCFFNENGFYGKTGDEGLGMGEDFDAITESKLAIKRHRPIPVGNHDSVDLLQDEDGDSIGAGSKSAKTLKQAALDRVGMIPTKSRTIMVKSILLAREEMDVMKGLDHRYTGDMISRDNSGGTNRMGLKSQLEQIWPLSIARWWLNVGQQEQPAVPKVGKIPDLLLKHIRADTMEASNLDAKERNKWFSWYYSQVKVCESCYFIYQELESFRQNKTKELQRNARFESDEYKMTAEQRREKDREIERRIFQQRKLMTRLSKCKSAPALGENDRIQEPRGLNNSPAVLPLTHWKASTRFNVESLHKSSIANHIMNKHIHVRSNDTDDMDVLHQWEKMTAIPEKPKLPAVRAISKKPPKKMVSVENYTASHLLHPWQRELGKLREQVANGAEVLQPSLMKERRTIAPSIVLHHNEEDEEEENDFGELGWSPFVI